MSATTTSVTPTTFDAEVLRSPIPVVVDFWADWCGPCKAISPALEEIAREAGGALKVVKIDIEAHPDLARRLGIQSVPTLLAVKGGVVVGRSVGAKPKGAMKRWIADSM